MQGVSIPSMVIAESVEDLAEDAVSTVLTRVVTEHVASVGKTDGEAEVVSSLVSQFAMIPPADTLREQNLSLAHLAHDFVGTACSVEETVATCQAMVDDVRRAQRKAIADRRKRIEYLSRAAVPSCLPVHNNPRLRATTKRDPAIKMEQLSAVQKCLVRWMTSLTLTATIPHPELWRKEYSNGLRVAEILHKYYPSCVTLHSFSSAVGRKAKEENWALIVRIIKKRLSIDFDTTELENILDITVGTDVGNRSATKLLVAFYNVLQQQDLLPELMAWDIRHLHLQDHLKLALKITNRTHQDSKSGALITLPPKQATSEHSLPEHSKGKITNMGDAVLATVSGMKGRAKPGWPSAAQGTAEGGTVEAVPRRSSKPRMQVIDETKARNPDGAAGKSPKKRQVGGGPPSSNVSVASRRLMKRKEPAAKGGAHHSGHPAFRSSVHMAPSISSSPQRLPAGKFKNQYRDRQPASVNQPAISSTDQAPSRRHGGTQDRQPNQKSQQSALERQQQAGRSNGSPASSNVHPSPPKGLPGTRHWHKPGQEHEQAARKLSHAAVIDAGQGSAAYNTNGSAGSASSYSYFEDDHEVGMVASSDASGAEVFFADVDASSALLPHDSASALVEPGGDQDDGFYNTPPHPALVDLPEGIVPDELGFFRASSRDSWEQITAPSSATSSLSMTSRPTEEERRNKGGLRVG